MARPRCGVRMKDWKPSPPVPGVRPPYSPPPPHLGQVRRPLVPHSIAGQVQTPHRSGSPDAGSQQARTSRLGRWGGVRGGEEWDEV